MPRRLKATMVNPIVAPPRKAMVNAFPGRVRAAWAVRTLARVATFIPMVMASIEMRAPQTKPKAICHRGHMTMSSRAAPPTMK